MEPQNLERLGLILNIVGSILLAADQFEFFLKIERWSKDLIEKLRPPTEEEINKQRERQQEAYTYLSLIGSWDPFADMIQVQRGLNELNPVEERDVLSCSNTLAVIGIIFCSSIILLLYWALISVNVLWAKIGISLSIVPFALLLFLSIWLILPLLGVGLLWLPNKILKTRGHFTGFGVTLLLIGFVLQLISSYL